MGTLYIMATNLRVFSYGGGVQSTAVLVLAAQGRLSYDHFVFAHVGEDSENPRTLAYLDAYAQPFARTNGLDLRLLPKLRRDGSVETLRQRLVSTARSVPIPVRMSNGAPGRRTCTTDFKIRVIAPWLRQHGATVDCPARVGLGISTDELDRARTDSGIAWETLEYPLLDLRLNRADCVQIITMAALPVPPKSSCYFCPFHSRREWQRLSREAPALFADAVWLEEQINHKRNAVLGKDKVWLTGNARPLRDLVGTHQQSTLDDLWSPAEGGGCDSGYCWT